MTDTAATPEQLEYAKRWMQARGKRPYRCEWRESNWEWDWCSDYEYCNIPWVLWHQLQFDDLNSEDAAVNALALALAEVTIG